MQNTEKDVFLNAVVEIGKLYAFLAHALRVVIDPEAATGMPESLFNAQLVKVRADLAPILSKQKIVQENLAAVDQRVMAIREAASEDRTHAGAVQAARTLLPLLEERSLTLSDLVALFRRF